VLQVGGGEAVAPGGVEQDRDAGEGFEDVEQLFVRGVIGDEVAEVDRAEAAARVSAARPPPEMQMFSAEYWDPRPLRYSRL
jgi:hypothetical protein